MIIETLPVGLLQCNCTILGCEDSKEAIVVDPGGDVAQIMEIVKHHDLTVKKIVHTHAHFDHITGTKELHELTGAEIMLHPGDKFLYDNADQQVKMFASRMGSMRLPMPETVDYQTELADNDMLNFGKDYAMVFHTPGHTPGSVCFCVRRKSEKGSSEEQVLLSGDTLFRRGVGRTDLWGGDQAAMFQSIKTKILNLDDDTRVIPGHGPETVIGDERRHNAYIN